MITENSLVNIAPATTYKGQMVAGGSMPGVLLCNLAVGGKLVAMVTHEGRTRILCSPKIDTILGTDAKHLLLFCKKGPMFTVEEAA